MKTYSHFKFTCEECGEVWTIDLHDQELTEQEASDLYGACESCPGLYATAVNIEKKHKKH